MLANIYLVTIDELRGSTLVSACVKGLHVKYTIRRTDSCAGVVVALQVMGGVSVAKCDGTCKSTTNIQELFEDECRLFAEVEYVPGAAWERFAAHVQKRYGSKPESLGRRFRQLDHSSGDGETWLACDGSYHVEAECTEYGMGFTYQVVKPCDRTCRCRAELPPSVVRAIRETLVGDKRP